MTRLRIWALVAALALAGGVLGFVLYARMTAQSTAAQDPGGAFSMVDQDGRPVTEADLRGRPTVMFFGFTYCPEICPTTLSDLTTAMASMGPDADRLNVVFVSVDPERDTPAQLKLYLSNFDHRIRGFTGTPEQVRVIANAYRVLYLKVPTEYGYTMDHTADLYLMDRHGRFVGKLRYGAGPDGTAEALRRLVRGQSPVPA